MKVSARVIGLSLTSTLRGLFWISQKPHPIIVSKLNRNLLKMPTGGRLTIWLFTKSGGAEFGTTKHISTSGREEDLNPGPTADYNPVP